MTRRWSVAEDWALRPSEDGLVVTRAGVPAHLRVDPFIAAEVLEAVMGEAVVPGSLSAAAGRVLDGLDRRGALVAELVLDGQLVARHVPGPGRAGPPRTGWALPARPHPTTGLRSPRGTAELAGARTGDRVVLLSSWAIGVASRLFDGSAPIGSSREEAELVDLAGRAGLLADDDPSDPTAGWELHDALMHGGSRLDTRAAGYGDSFPHGQPVHAEGVPRPTIGERVPLRSLADARRGLSLEEALRLRVSSRDHGGRPVGRAQIGSLLDGSLRVRRRVQGPAEELAWRPVPTGGARSGLSAVVIANRVGDLERGVYEYDAVSHDLAPTAGPWPAMDRWLALAGRMTGIDVAEVQALLLMTLDYRRPAQKYEAIVYATALKEAGAVLQSLALVSTDLGLSFCPMGGGFASTAGLGSDVREVAVVCEAVIGTPGSVDGGGARS